MLNKNLFSILLMAALSAPALAHAQKSDASDDLDVIEMEIDKQAPKKEPAPAAPTYDESQKDNSLTDFKGLGTLAPFQEVSVIQKRFLPKTGRFELFGGLTAVTNDPFFSTIGAVGKAAYFLNETWGVELNYFGLTTSDRDAVKDLKSSYGVATESLAYPKSYFGVDVVYVPIYGKMTWFNERILPFDLYFSGGYGSTNTSGGENAGTVHIATGQTFALTKAFAFRWDFSWNFYSASYLNSTTNVRETNSFNNLFLTVGMSWFFPEASYR